MRWEPVCGQAGKMDQEIPSALAAAAVRARWGASEWERLCAGSFSVSAAAFEDLERAEGGRFEARAKEEQWAWRFASMSPGWRAIGACMDQARLGELLCGNLSGDDSGIDPLYETEREALRMLCLARVFKESSLRLGDPDPRINSLRRIKLGRWREFPLAAFPGMGSSPGLRAVLGSLRLGWIAESLGGSELSGAERRASLSGIALGVAVAGACAAAAAWVPSRAEAVWFVALCAGASFSPPWASSWLRRRASRRALEAVLRGLGCPPPKGYESAARKALGDAARAAGGPEADEFARRAERGGAGWEELGSATRRQINQERARRARASLAQLGPRVACSELEALAVHVPEPKRPGGLGRSGRL